MPNTIIPAPAEFVKKTDIVNNLTSTATDKPLSANMGKTLEDHIQQSTATVSGVATVPSAVGSTIENIIVKSGNVVTIALWINLTSGGVSGTNATIATIPNQYIPSAKRTIGGYVESENSIHMFYVNTSGEIVTRTTSRTYTGSIRIFDTYII